MVARLLRRTESAARPGRTSHPWCEKQDDSSILHSNTSVLVFMGSEPVTRPASGVVIEEDLVGEAVSIPSPHAGVDLCNNSGHLQDRLDQPRQRNAILNPLETS